MSKTRSQLGRKGEEAAAVYLCEQGYQIVEQNFRNQIGEVDLIAQDGDILAFIEVKTRSHEEHVSAFESVTPAKQGKIVRVALSYLKYKRLDDIQVRFDVIAVTGHEDQITKIELIKDAFQAY